jgi:hypothetical protein
MAKNPNSIKPIPIMYLYAFGNMTASTLCHLHMSGNVYFPFVRMTVMIWGEFVPVKMHPIPRTMTVAIFSGNETSLGGPNLIGQGELVLSN